MDHVVIPLRGDHLRSARALAAAAAGAAGVERPPDQPAAHITLVAYQGIGRDPARRAVGAVSGATAPFVLHAHGYGFFTGDSPTDLCLHVPVVRAGALDALHAALCGAIERAGGTIATWSAPDRWSPHITLLDRVLDPARLGAAAASLAGRHHPSWTVTVDRLMLTGAWRDHDRPGDMVRLGSGRPGPPA